MADAEPPKPPSLDGYTTDFSERGDEMAKALQELRAKDGAAAKEIEMVFRAYIGRYGSLDNDKNIGTMQRPVTLMSNLNEKIYEAVKSIGLDGTEIRTGLPRNTSELISLMINGLGVPEEHINYIVNRRKEIHQKGELSDQDRKRIAYLQRRLSGRLSRERRRNIERILNEFSKGMRSSILVHGQTRSRYNASNQGVPPTRYWEIYNENSKQWEVVDGTLEEVDLDLMRARSREYAAQDRTRRSRSSSTGRFVSRSPGASRSRRRFRFQDRTPGSEFGRARGRESAQYDADGKYLPTPPGKMRVLEETPPPAYTKVFSHSGSRGEVFLITLPVDLAGSGHKVLIGGKNGKLTKENAHKLEGLGLQVDFDLHQTRITVPPHLQNWQFGRSGTPIDLEGEKMYASELFPDRPIVAYWDDIDEKGQKEFDRARQTVLAKIIAERRIRAKFTAVESASRAGDAKGEIVAVGKDPSLLETDIDAQLYKGDVLGLYRDDGTLFGTGVVQVQEVLKGKRRTVLWVEGKSLKGMERKLRVAALTPSGAGKRAEAPEAIPTPREEIPAPVPEPREEIPPPVAKPPDAPPERA